jgi:membrane protein DedA with SNARE-associated domain
MEPMHFHLYPAELASISSQLTSGIAHHGLYAVFVLMAVDALLPVGGELVMLYAGVLASGVLAAHFGLGTGLGAYLALAASGTVGYLVGSWLGWALGFFGGRTLVERHGRWVHLTPERLARAERWFNRHGALSVFVGKLTPLVRSFISVPAGVFETPFPLYTLLSLAAGATWCFGFAAAGWALGGSWQQLHHAFRFADYAGVALVAAAVAYLVLRGRRATRPAGDLVS